VAAVMVLIVQPVDIQLLVHQILAVVLVVKVEHIKTLPVVLVLLSFDI
jgi:hypothetical protein